jgi:hypothetical protein
VLRDGNVPAEPGKRTTFTGRLGMLIARRTLALPGCASSRPKGFRGIVRKDDPVFRR